MTRSRRWFSFLAALTTLVLVAGAGRAEAVVEIQWWHAMDGALEEWVKELADGSTSPSRSTTSTPSTRATTRGHDRRDRRVPRRQAPHIVQVFEVGTATMMAAKGADQAGLRADGGRRREVRPEGLPAGGRRLLHDRRRAHAVVPVQQLDAGPLLQQGRVQEGGARSGQAAEDLARDRASTAKKLKARGQPVRLHDRLADVDAARELPRLAQRADRDQAERLRRPRHRAPVQPPAARAHIDRSGRQWQKTRPSTTAGARATPKPKFATRRMRDDHSRRRRATRTSPRRRPSSSSAIGMMPYWPTSRARRRTRSSAARRCGCCPARSRRSTRAWRSSSPILSSPEVQAAWHQRTGLPADHAGGLRADEEAGFYEKNPGTDVADPADEQQAADRELQGAAPRQLRPDPRRDGRGAGSRLGGQEEPPRRRWTRSSSAATSSCGSSSAPTSRPRLSRDGAVRAGRAASPRERRAQARRFPEPGAAIPPGGAADRSSPWSSSSGRPGRCWSSRCSSRTRSGCRRSSCGSRTSPASSPTPTTFERSASP